MEYTDFAARYRPAIAACLEQQLQQVTHPGLRAVMAHLLGRGKLFRPLLALATARACGSDESRFVRTAAPLEMIHTFTLIHDDLPCMDDARLRRGVDAVHIKFGEAQAVLGGDALLNFALYCIADNSALDGDRRSLELIREVTWATHLVVEGQMLDIELEGQDCTEDQLEHLHFRKTGALLAACCSCGAVLAGCNAEQTGQLREFGMKLGLLFQIRDDLLSVEGTEVQIGKSLDTDHKLQKSTYPRILGVERTKAKLAGMKDELLQLAGELGKSDAELLPSIVEYTTDRES